jgi:hypothetical protein
VAAADHDGSPWVEDRTVAASAPALSTEEAALVAALRPDAAVDCAPRRTDLPARATAGVECHPGAGPVARVGAYRFGDAHDAALTYLERMTSYDVAPASGDCAHGISGDAAWMPGDGAGGTTADRVAFGDSGPWAVGRSGCFLNDYGNANVRLTCGPTSVGILGRTDDLAALHRWAWLPAVGSPGSGERPGICEADA